MRKPSNSASPCRGTADQAKRRAPKEPHLSPTWPKQAGGETSTDIRLTQRKSKHRLKSQHTSEWHLQYYIELALLKPLLSPPPDFRFISSRARDSKRSAFFKAGAAKRRRLRHESDHIKNLKKMLKLKSQTNWHGWTSKPCHTPSHVCSHSFFAGSTSSHIKNDHRFPWRCEFHFRPQTYHALWKTNSKATEISLGCIAY